MTHQGDRQAAPDPSYGPLYKQLLGLLPALAIAGAVTAAGATLAVGAGMGLDALASWLLRPCFSTATTAGGIGEHLSHIRSLVLGLGGSGTAISLLLLSGSATNEAMHHTARVYLKGGLLALALAAAAYPFIGVIGCVAL